MTGKWLREFFILVGVLFVLYVATPFLPTSLMIQIRDLSVTPDQMVYLTRTVTAPTEGHFSIEVMRDGDTLLPRCNRSGEAFYEERGDTPINYKLNCAPLPEGEYEMRMCISADGPFNTRLSPSCVAAPFTVGLDKQSRLLQLQEQVNMLEELVQELKGD